LITLTCDQWSALGYTSWEDCAKAEFGKSRSYVFQLVAAAEVEDNLTSAREKSTIVDFDNIPVSHLTALAKLPPEQQAEGLLKASQIAQEQGKKRNANHIAQAVQEIKQPLVDTVEDTDMQQPSSEPNYSSDADNEPEPSATVQNMSIEQIAPLLQAIAHKASVSDALDSQPDLELKQMLKNALQIIKTVKRKLNQRRYTSN
jgi:diadenosine tetraphosphate (Ap4A) HIT family hydrolase